MTTRSDLNCKVDGCERKERWRGLCAPHRIDEESGVTYREIPKKRAAVEHGTITMNNRGCKCPECDGLRNAYNRRKYAERKALLESKPATEYVHGESRTYYNGCKCDKCRKGHADRTVVRKYGLSQEQLENLDELRAGDCACCGKPSSVTGLMVVDHDHATGKVRGFICNMCNTGIGKLGDSVKGLETALAYLIRTR